MVIFHSYVSFEGMFTHMLHGAGILNYLTTGDFVRANVGKYSSTMEHMGYVCLNVFLESPVNLVILARFTRIGRKRFVMCFFSQKKRPSEVVV